MTKQRLEELRRTFGQDNWLHSQAGNQVRQLLGWDEEDTDPSNERLLAEERLESDPLQILDGTEISNTQVSNSSPNQQGKSLT